MKRILLTLGMVWLGSPMLHAQTETAPATDTIRLSREGRPGLNPSFADGGALHQDKKKNGPSISIGSGGIRYERGDRDTVKHRFELQFGMLDVGINSLIDHSSYEPALIPSVAGPNFFQVPAENMNKDLFSLRQSKSINVNIYPILLKALLHDGKKQKLTLATGLGLQLYNFRFTKPVSYVADPTTHVILDTVSFSKNKLAFNYLTVPLMLNGKTKIGAAGHKISQSSAGYWLTYGIGISGGYLLSSWTKQISDERGKEKNHDPFNFRKTNLCVNGEIGLDGYIRLYATYQLTSLHEDVLDQHPLCIGIRFLGL